jgi:hypothetical protein
VTEVIESSSSSFSGNFIKQPLEFHNAEGGEGLRGGRSNIGLRRIQRKIRWNRLNIPFHTDCENCHSAEVEDRQNIV